MCYGETSQSGEGSLYMNRNAKNSTIVVHRPAGFRVLYYCLIILLSFSLIVFYLQSVEMGNAMLFPIGISILLCIGPLLYYSIWRMKLTKSGIILNSFFKKRKYNYSQIKAIYLYETGFWGKRLWIDLENGKRITIRSNYTNFTMAINALREHHPVRSLSSK